MAKKCILLFLMFAICFLAKMLCANGATVVVDDTFDEFRNGEVPTGWTFVPNSKNAGDYGEVTTDPDDPSNKCLLINRTATNVLAYRHFESIGGEITIEYKVRYDFNRIQHLGRVSGHDEFEQVNDARILLNMVYADAYVYQNGPGGNDANHRVPNMPPVYETWLTMRYEINTATKRYSIFVNDVKSADEFRFRALDCELANLLTFENFSGRVYVDDVKISYVGGIIKNYTRLLSEKYYVNPNIDAVKNIPFETEVATFTDNFTFVDGAKYHLEQNRPGRYVLSGDKLIIKSPDGTQEKVFAIFMNSLYQTKVTTLFLRGMTVLLKDSPDMLHNNFKEYIRSDNTQIRPFEQDGTIFIPIDALARAMGARIIYNGQTVEIAKQIIDTKNNQLTVNGITNPINTATIADYLYTDIETAEKITGKSIYVDGNFIMIGKSLDLYIPSIKLIIEKELTRRFETI